MCKTLEDKIPQAMYYLNLEKYNYSKNKIHYTNYPPYKIEYVEHINIEIKNDGNCTLKTWYTRNNTVKNEIVQTLPIRKILTDYELEEIADDLKKQVQAKINNTILGFTLF